MTLDDILAEIKNAENIVVMAHEQPDGDAIGSSLAMCLVLKNMGKNVQVLLKKVPENFKFLPGFDEIKEERLKVWFSVHGEEPYEWMMRELELKTSKDKIQKGTEGRRWSPQSLRRE